jgi:hypothetical protein
MVISWSRIFALVGLILFFAVTMLSDKKVLRYEEVMRFKRIGLIIVSSEIKEFNDCILD